MDIVFLIFVVVYVIIDISNSRTFQKEMFSEIDYLRYEINRLQIECQELRLNLQKNRGEIAVLEYDIRRLSEELSKKQKP